MQGVLADVSIATGSVTIGLMLTGRFVFQYLGWGVAAAATPVVMAITGSAFFGMSLAAQYGTALTFGPYSLAAAGVMAGAVTQATPCTLTETLLLHWLHRLHRLHCCVLAAKAALAVLAALILVVLHCIHHAMLCVASVCSFHTCFVWSLASVGQPILL